MEVYEGVLKAVERELEAVSKKGLKSLEDVHAVYEMIDIAKDIYCIWAYEDQMEEPEEEGMFSRNSYQGGGSNRGSYRGGSYNSYEGGGSYGGSYEGYSNRRNSRRNSRNGGSYRNSRADEKSFIEKMQKMRDEAPDEQTMMEIDNLLAQMG